MSEEIRFLTTKDGVSFHCPDYKGKIVINGSLEITCKDKPNIIHRAFTRLLLGWKWEELKEDV